jgi:predicted dehydrogenase
MVDSERMKVGIIGAGLQGRRRAQSLKQSDDAELVVVAAAHKEKARLLADEMDCEATNHWEDVVGRQDIATVIVCTPPNLHLPMCTAALKQGKHTLCEKPLARNPEEARQIVAAAYENGVKLKCGFNLRHHDSIRQAREWFEQGIIGEPFSLRICYGIGGRPGYDKEWRANAEMAGGGQLMDQGMHAIDLARWFLGDFSEAVGFLATSFWDVAPLEDNAFALLRTENGRISSICVSWTQWKNLFSFELVGRDGYITVEGLGGGYGVERAILGKRAFLKPFKEEIIEYRGSDGSWVGEWQEFSAAIREGREPLGSGHDGFQAVRLAYAIYESGKTGKVVRV